MERPMEKASENVTDRAIGKGADNLSKNCYILYFDEINPHHFPLVGGKGANLGEMTRAGFPVPYGFCVTTESYNRFIQANSLDQTIADLVKDANLDNIKVIGASIRENLKQAAIPEPISQAILQAMQKTGPDTYYAVRSSATAEDLPFASFAGQQDTYLNIRGQEALLHAVRDCWASLFTDRAILYRSQNQIPHEKVQMSVVIQKMVLPEVSGIMFTADPVSGHRGIVSIDAGYGLGEALVSGLVSPDIYKFTKSTRQIAGKTIAEKKLAILPLEGGGTQKVELGGAKATSQVLDDALIQSLAELGMKIEKHYGCPQDIEWCISRDNPAASSGSSALSIPSPASASSDPSTSPAPSAPYALSIVQSRAITSLFPLPAPLPQDDALHAYISFNHFQVMTAPISPLGIDMLRIIASFEPEVRSAEGYRYMKSAGGRIYIDLSELLANKHVRKFYPLVLQNADALMSSALVELTQRPDFDGRIKKNKSTFKGFKGFFKPIVYKALKTFLDQNPEGTLNRVNDYMERRIQEASAQILEAKPGIERLNAIVGTASFRPDFQVLLPKMLPAMISFKALENLEEKLLGSHRYTDLIVKGLEGNITTEMGLLVGDLADQVRKSPDLIREFEDSDYKTLFARVDNLPGHENFKKIFQFFMTTYDIRAAGEIDMAKERWIENPEPLAKAILATVRTASEGTHRTEYQATISAAKQAAEELVKEVAAKHGKLKAKVVSRVIRVLRSCLPVREHPKYLIMKLILICKKAFLAEAELLVQKGQLTAVQDIFYLGFWELYQGVQNGESLTGLVEERKEAYRHYARLSAPRLLTSDGEEIKASYRRENLPPGALPGMPVSSGAIEGIARVITDPAQASLNKGEILVAPFTDPGWTPLFINAAGLVMEVGGLLTHGTVVAREYGIPAVVGITDATKIIKDGQKIRVDGDGGFVLMLDE